MNEWILFFIPPLLYLMYKIISGYPIYVPLPENTVRKMLKLAKVRKGDVVYDLGAGDGRVTLIAAKEFGAVAVGIEKNWLLSRIAAWRVSRAGMKDIVKIVNKDFFKCRLKDADVVVLYLTQKLNDKLEPKFKKELRNGTRIVSASHVFKGWKPVKRIRTGHFYSYLYKI